MESSIPVVEAPEPFYNVPRPCPRCKKKDAIPAGDKKMNCASCREIKKRARDNERLASSTSGNQGDKAGETTGKREANGSEHGLPPKKKNKVTNDASKARSSEPKRKRAKPRRLCVEYQFASDLYEALQKSITSGIIRKFSGCFSVIADPKINHLARAGAVANDLRTVVKFPLASISSWNTSNTSSAHIAIRCECLALEGAAGAPKSDATPLRVSPQSNAIPPNASEKVNETQQAQTQTNGDKMVQALEASFARTCGGKVKILVENDTSHPLIVGHRVVVDVIH